MASRASLHPNAATGAPRDASAIKERQIHVLADRLAELSNRVVALDGQIKLASAHAEVMRDFAGQQAALCVQKSLRPCWRESLMMDNHEISFMAAERVFLPHAEEETQSQ